MREYTADFRTGNDVSKRIEGRTPDSRPENANYNTQNDGMDLADCK